jgi:hypothetical protein
MWIVKSGRVLARAGPGVELRGDHEYIEVNSSGWCDDRVSVWMLCGPRAQDRHEPQRCPPEFGARVDWRPPRSASTLIRFASGFWAGGVRATSSMVTRRFGGLTFRSW